MLPKPIKTKKIKSEQLDLIEEISEKDRLKKKQRYLFISLALTIGLSLIFYTYKHFRLPRLSIPKNIEITNSFSLDLDKNSGVYIKSADYTYTQNFSKDVASELKYLDNIKVATDSALYEKIPKGVTVRQFEEKNKSEFNGLYRLTVPSRDIYIIFNFKGSNIEKNISLIPNLVEKIYWHLVQ